MVPCLEMASTRGIEHEAAAELMRMAMFLEGDLDFGLMDRVKSDCYPVSATALLTDVQTRFARRRRR